MSDNTNNHDSTQSKAKRSNQRPDKQLKVRERVQRNASNEGEQDTLQAHLRQTGVESLQQQATLPQAGVNTHHLLSPTSLSTPGIIQTKMEVSTPSDVYEQEADRVVDEVMRRPSDLSWVGQKAPTPAKSQLKYQANERQQRIVARVAETDTPEVAPQEIQTEFEHLKEEAAEKLGQGDIQTPEGAASLEGEKENLMARAETAIEEKGAAAPPGVQVKLGGLLNKAKGMWAKVRNDKPEDTAEATAEAQALATAPIRFKAKAGGANAANPQMIQRQLGQGQSLNSRTRMLMERAFGRSFSDVRVHTDTTAVQLSRQLNARAFAVGNNIAFNTGEYKPGTIVGDALIAHELAHVTQQSGATAQQAMTKRGENEAAIEQDADNSAINAMFSIWSRGKLGAENIAREAMPRLYTGLGLRRCNGSSRTLPKVTLGNFRNSGSVSPNNNCSLCSTWSTLGLRTSTGHNVMELRGEIEGHFLGAEYDIKRTKERATWTKTGGSWTQLTHVGPGADDDSHDSDEDLSPDASNHIYAIDGPGFRSASGPDASADEAVYKANFVEFVNVRQDLLSSWTKNSNEFRWHSITWLEKVGGTWRRKAGQNEIETGHTTVGTGDP